MRLQLCAVYLETITCLIRFPIMWDLNRLYLFGVQKTNSRNWSRICVASMTKVFGSNWKLFKMWYTALSGVSKQFQTCFRPLVVGPCQSWKRKQKKEQKHTITRRERRDNIMTKIVEGSLEVKLPTIWTDEKQRWEESEKRRQEKRREEKRRRKKIKKHPGARKGKKVAKHCFSNDLWLRRVEK